MFLSFLPVPKGLRIKKLQEIAFLSFEKRPEKTREKPETQPKKKQQTFSTFSPDVPMAPRPSRRLPGGAVRLCWIGFGGLQHPGPAAAGEGTDDRDSESVLSGAGVSRHVLAATGGRNMGRLGLPDGFWWNIYIYIIIHIQIILHTLYIYIYIL